MITDIGREEGTTKRVASYARVSTLNHGQDPEVQLRELREFCQRRRFEIAVEYVDKGISGSRERRPSLEKLMTACRKRLVDTSWCTATTDLMVYQLGPQREFCSR
jgi:DNA invertase Pin-like site-specific DNA recombinase